MRVFLCDDNNEYRTLARIVLRRGGFEVVGEASDGAEALARAPEAAPEVILLDLNMPRMNGLQTLPPLRAILPDAKVIVLTSGQASDERERALRAGAHGFLAKPASIFRLADEVRAALEDGSRPGA